MAKIVFPIFEIEGDKLQVTVDLSLYSREALSACLYKYSGEFFVHAQSENNFVHVVFESKTGEKIEEIRVKEFCNALLDEQIRFDVNRQFGHIRDMIVEEAFRPVNAKR